ncbi:MAG: glycoside hydrolase family 3 C-terminal domain-containing protein [Oscillospiraceae bacterium]|nr:glycoside hydrolase family 3 C-terminal domain-containing protein [Oscillospiraceae bacterium]
MNIREKTTLLSKPADPYAEKIKALLEQMTLDEKIAQLRESWGIAGCDRLGIPPLYKGECVHGYSYGTGCTVFPHAIAMAATWDVDTVHKVAEVTAAESIAANAFQAWSPVLDVARDPRWGRVEESFGEDTYLVEQIGLAWINGYQSLGLTATPKHFAAHGSPLGGRDSNYVGYSERVLREVHYPPFRTAFKEGKSKSVMSAYHVLNGVPCSGSYDLLTKLLREEWGFDGYVVTDVGAPEHLYQKHTMAADDAEAAAILAKAGVDLCATGDVYGNGLKPALEEGLIDMSDIDAMVANILRVKFELGVFDRESNPPMRWADVAEWNAPEHREVALETARKSMVLLENDGILPLSKSVGKVALIGPAVKDQQLGDYSAKTVDGQLVTIYQGIADKIGEENIIYAEGCGFMEGNDKKTITDEMAAQKYTDFSTAVEAAKKADVVIIAVGDCTRGTGENNDRASLRFTGLQEKLIEYLCAEGKPVVLVAACGKPVILETAAEHANAILFSWYSGQEGGNAVADILFGDVCPGGKLPISIPSSNEQLPIHYNYHASGRKYGYIDMTSEPRYRFGYGLSYSSFEYSGLTTAMDGDNVKVTVTVKNTGAITADEVVQLYVSDMQSSVSTPVVELKGFKRVTLAAGEEKSVAFTLTPYQLSLLDEKLYRRVEKGGFRVFAGGVSPVNKPGNEYRKAGMHYENASEGVSGEFFYAKDICADFAMSLREDGGQYIFTIKNQGGLTDVFSADFYADGTLYANRRGELDPGEEQVIGVNMDKKADVFTVVCRDKILTV